MSFAENFFLLPGDVVECVHNQEGAPAELHLVVGNLYIVVDTTSEAEKARPDRAAHVRVTDMNKVVISHTFAMMRFRLRTAKCTCPSMMSGCTCGAFKREMTAKNNPRCVSVNETANGFTAGQLAVVTDEDAFGNLVLDMVAPPHEARRINRQQVWDAFAPEQWKKLIPHLDKQGK